MSQNLPSQVGFYLLPPESKQQYQSNKSLSKHYRQQQQQQLQQQQQQQFQNYQNLQQVSRANLMTEPGLRLFCVSRAASGSHSTTWT